MLASQMEIHRDWRMVVQPSLARTPSFELLPEGEPPPLPTYETLEWPPWLQKRIMEERDRFVERHEGVIPNILILQDSWLVSAQFHSGELDDPRSDYTKERITAIYDKLEEWQGQMLFEWYGLKVYNRHHVIGNRDLPMILLEVRGC